MTTITTRTDLITYLQDTRADLATLGDRYVQAVCDQIQASDHPAWGQDWTEWLAETVDSTFVETVVDGVDALDGANAEPSRLPMYVAIHEVDRTFAIQQQRAANVIASQCTIEQLADVIANTRTGRDAFDNGGDGVVLVDEGERIRAATSTELLAWSDALARAWRE